MQRGSTGRGFLRAGRRGLRLELFLELLEGELQRAQAHRLDVADIDLIFAANFVDAERAAHGDVQAIFRAEFQAAPDRESRRSESASAHLSA